VGAAKSGDGDRVAALVDVSYDLEAWSGADLSALRERLDAVGDGTNY